jgi:hypothetical protein
LEGDALPVLREGLPFEGARVSKVRERPALEGARVPKVRERPALEGARVSKVRERPALEGARVPKVRERPAFEGEVLPVLRERLPFEGDVVPVLRKSDLPSFPLNNPHVGGHGGEPMTFLLRRALTSAFALVSLAGPHRAWDAYLAAYPHGRFELEARYNRATTLLRIGRDDEARAALLPFAKGAYRAREARLLLEALGESR